MTRPKPDKPRASKGRKRASNGISAANGAGIPADASEAADTTPLPPRATELPESWKALPLSMPNAHTAQGLESGKPQSRVNPTSAEPVKERRGRRYKTFESIRRGLASVANRVELGTLDVKQAAVAVQALNALLATVSAMTSAEMEGQSKELEEQAAEAATAPEEAYGDA